MTDRPIPFVAPMICALLAGRKTQTRRVAKFQPSDDANRDVAKAVCWPKTAEGDRLWVREAWRAPLNLNDKSPSQIGAASLEGGWKRPWSPVQFEADSRREKWSWDDWPEQQAGRYRHARYMPRWTSRITLHVTDVRVQRLHEISPADAIAEGIEQDARTGGFWGANGQGVGGATRLYTQSDRAFADLWDSLNAARGFGWAENPWVVATSFTVTLANIDQLDGDQ